jgi:hypothetical protein
MKINELNPGEKQKFEPSNTEKGQTFHDFVTQCSQSIAEMQKADKFLFRGLRDAPKIFVGAPRTNRKALDTDQAVNNAFDEMLKASGFKALRSNSIFCFGGDSYAVSEFGKPYMIFPKNGYQLTWSPKVMDFTNELPYRFQPEDFWQLSEKAMQVKKVMDDDESRNEVFTLIDKLTNLMYSDIPSENKLAIRDMKIELGKLVYNDAQLPFNLKKLLTLDKDTDYCITYMPYIRKLAEAQQLFFSMKGNVDPMNVVIKGLGYQKTDLAAAIKSKKEIMISGEYYAFEVKTYLAPMQKALLS